MYKFNLSNCPPEILEAIFQYLPPRDNLTVLPLACKQFRAILLQSNLGGILAIRVRTEYVNYKCLNLGQRQLLDGTCPDYIPVNSMGPRLVRGINIVRKGHYFPTIPRAASDKLLRGTHFVWSPTYNDVKVDKRNGKDWTADLDTLLSDHSAGKIRTALTIVVQFFLRHVHSYIPGELNNVAMHEAKRYLIARKAPYELFMQLPPESSLTQDRGYLLLKERT
ncbi:hypothetical protein HDU93_008917 [Gonapodya sp. JEL0774]|nr:hypothetical protein HDU93_008917 [Gonapodya sp. JEL0774]